MEQSIIGMQKEDVHNETKGDSINKDDELRCTSPSTPFEFRGMYDWCEPLGRGKFSQVRRGENFLTRDNVAIKIIDKIKLPPEELEAMHTEVRVLKFIQHPHVVKLYQVIETESSLNLILEFGEGGDLLSYLQKHIKLSESKAQHIFRQITSGLQYCHEQNVIHRDLKPENIIITDKKTDFVKIADFGLSNNFAKGEKMETMCGSLSYSAPEILLQDKYDGQYVDVWSLGVILFLMVAGKLPFWEANDSSTLVKILEVEYTIPDTLSKGCKNLIRKILVKEPNNRLHLKAILKQSWMNKGVPEDSNGPLTRQDSQPNKGSLASRKQSSIRKPKEKSLTKPVKRRSQSTSVTPELHFQIFQQMESLGFEKQKVKTSLSQNKYDFNTATYNQLLEHNQRVERGSSVNKTIMETKTREQDDVPTPITSKESKKQAKIAKKELQDLERAMRNSRNKIKKEQKKTRKSSNSSK
eukprot:m.61723 g.61723  ORF g.61723 m.61723 type:complete len:468 (+) comp11438_c0_seq1:340-1743(+)